MDEDRVEGKTKQAEGKAQDRRTTREERTCRLAE